MKIKIFLAFGLALLVTSARAITYSNLWIPPVLTGSTFYLNLHATNKFYFPGSNTVTYAYNDAAFWGPTLIMTNGDNVQIYLTNNLADTTTTHWHGFHIPAIMDGGPHEVIPAGTVWTPTFIVSNKAATYWYHPHLHTLTQTHLGRGAGGFIIVKDKEESALGLPRTYGVDDIPLVLTSRRFYTTTAQLNQLNVTNGNAGSAYGDYELVNGVINFGTTNVQVMLPQQYVRLRILNAEIERVYNLGFTNSNGNVTFFQIATDGGLVNTNVPLTRAVLGPGERIELLLNLATNTVGSTLDLISFSTSAALTATTSGLATAFPGGENSTTGQFGSLINNKDFQILHIVVTNQTANPVLTRPVILTTNAFWTVGDVTKSRTITLGGGQPPNGVFLFDNLAFSLNSINQYIGLGAVEQWTITNNSAFSHSFHIHDIEFNLISRTSSAGVSGIQKWEQGWKDTVYVQQNSAVTFLAKFDTFASPYNPFMYHCHMVNHEDEGTMAQFIVTNAAVPDLYISSFKRAGTNTDIAMNFKSTPGTTYKLFFSTNFTTGSWSDIATVTSDGTSVNYTETNTSRLSLPRGFYRINEPTNSY
jgi:bilirubin oxidase